MTQLHSIADDLRAQIAKSPEVTQTVSQMGRPDDGTDVVTFNDVEVSVAPQASGSVARRNDEGKA